MADPPFLRNGAVRPVDCRPRRMLRCPGRDRNSCMVAGMGRSDISLIYLFVTLALSFLCWLLALNTRSFGSKHHVSILACIYFISRY